MSESHCRLCGQLADVTVQPILPGLPALCWCLDCLAGALDGEATVAQLWAAERITVDVQPTPALDYASRRVRPGQPERGPGVE